MKSFTRDLLMEDIGMTLKIHPIGWKQVKQFAAVIVESTTFFNKISELKETDVNVRTQAAITTLVPFVMENMIDLMWANITYWEEKTSDDGMTSASQLKDFNCETLPHWYIPEIVTEWLKLNFDEEMKWRPWIGAIEEALSKVTGEPISISDMLSNFSLPTDTQGSTSSTAPESDGLTKD